MSAAAKRDLQAGVVRRGVVRIHGLVLDRGFHQVVPANRTVINQHVPRPEADRIPRFQGKPLRLDRGRYWRTAVSEGGHGSIDVALCSVKLNLAF